jgi:arylsulfatase
MNLEPKRIAVVAHASAFLFAAALAVAPAFSQTITGVPGSPSATITLDGKQLPPPPQKFGGVIKENALNSKPWWPSRVVPPKGAPNTLLIMTDGQGYGVHVRGRHPDAGAGPDREGWAEL